MYPYSAHPTGVCTRGTFGTLAGTLRVPFGYGINALLRGYRALAGPLKGP